MGQELPSDPASGEPPRLVRGGRTFFPCQPSRLRVGWGSHSSSSGGIGAHRMNSQHLRKRDEEIVRLCLEEGLKRKEVAARFDLRPETVSRILARASMHRGQLRGGNALFSQVFVVHLDVVEFRPEYRRPSSPTGRPCEVGRRRLGLGACSPSSLPTTSASSSS